LRYNIPCPLVSYSEPISDFLLNTHCTRSLAFFVYFVQSRTVVNPTQVCPQVCIRSQVPQTSHSIYCIAGDAGTVLYQSPVTQVRHIASDYRLVKNLHPRAETVRKSAPPHSHRYYYYCECYTTLRSCYDIAMLRRNCAEITRPCQALRIRWHKRMGQRRLLFSFVTTGPECPFLRYT
jgi:hypothetical protein